MWKEGEKNKTVGDSMKGSEALSNSINDIDF